MGVRPEQIPDLLALKGDAIDNIPGAPGIGEKGARELIRRFGTVEAALERAAEVERRTYRESLINNRDLILLSKRLATINPGAPIEPDLGQVGGAPSGRGGPAPDLQGAGILQLAEGTRTGSGPASAGLPDGLFGGRDSAWLAAIPADAPVAIAWEVAPQTDDLLAETADGQGRLALAFRPGEVRCAPLAWLYALRPWLEDENRPKATHDLKSFLLLMAEARDTARGLSR
jgi:DNA polymerase-1